MSENSTIIISSSSSYTDEAEMINLLFDAGLYRYHLQKSDATEQFIAEILEGVKPNYLSRISLHSHFHLVLAYGVGGIHFSQKHRISLGDEYISKIGLYQSFGVKVSTVIGEADRSPADYALLSDPKAVINDPNSIYRLTNDVLSIGSLQLYMQLDEVFETFSVAQIISALLEQKK